MAAAKSKYDIRGTGDKKDSRGKMGADDSDDDTDVEYYTNSYSDFIKIEPVKRMLNKKKQTKPVRIERKRNADIYTCSICFDDFSHLKEFLQHLSAGDCQPEDVETFECDVCQASLDDASDYRQHRLGHVEVSNFVCVACGRDFNSKRELDRHMFVDASILNQLFKNSKITSLPEMLCGTVVKNLAKSAQMLSGVGHESDDEDDNNTDEYEPKDLDFTKKKNLNKACSSPETTSNDNMSDETVDKAATCIDQTEKSDDEADDKLLESSLPTDAEEDYEDAGRENQNCIDEDREMGLEESSEENASDEDDGAIMHPFLSSSLTDHPIAPDQDDSVTSQSQDNAPDTSLPTSKRKNRHPKQIQQTAWGFKRIKGEDLAHSDEALMFTLQTDNQNMDTDDSLKCPMCGEKVAENQTLSSHLAEHEKLFPFFCTLCDCNFMKGHLLKNHVLSCHLVSESLHCELCSMTFKLKSSLRKHKRICKQSPECVVCGMSFKSGQELEKHFYGHTMEERSAVIYMACEECGEVFTSAQQLRLHQKSHSINSLYSCQICGAIFSKQKVLERHKQAHFREQDCKCHICGAQLLTLSGLLAHLRGHRNNQNIPFDQTFARLGFKSDGGKMDSIIRVVSMNDEKDGDGTEGEETEGKEKEIESEPPAETDEMIMSSEKYLKLIEDRYDSLDSGSSQQEKPGAVKDDDEASVSLISSCGKKLRPHCCPFCEASFYKIDRYQAHIRKDHEDQALFDECDVCQAKIYGKEYMRIHRRSHSSAQEKYSCDQCHKVFVRKWALETHRKVHSFRKFLKCDICSEGFRFVSELDRHIRRAHPVDKSQCTFKCNICSATFSSLAYLEIHCSHSHPPAEGQPYKCAICPMSNPSSFKSSNELRRHIHIVHGRLKNKPGDEDDTSDASSKPLELTADVKREPADDSYERVGKDDPLYGQVQDMIRNFVSSLPCRENSDIIIQPRTEDQDGEVEAYNRATRQRMSQSNMARKFECETCQKCFATKSDLRTHIRTHTGETPYKCDYCDRAFKQRGHRKLHIQVAHTKDMPYTCELCGQSYPTRYRYQVHVKRHSGIKEHKCQYCPDKAYYTVGKLNEHKRKHHLEEFLQEQADKEQS